MHVFLAFLLFIAVAFPGLANAHVYAQPCPMEHSKEVALIDAPAPVDDCCNDADTVGSTSEPCKSGQECSIAHTFAVVSLELAGRAPALGFIAPTAEFAPHSFDLVSIWRPPTIR